MLQLQKLSGETDETRSGNGRSLTLFYHEQRELVRARRWVTKVITRTLDCFLLSIRFPRFSATRNQRSHRISSSDQSFAYRVANNECFPDEKRALRNEWG